MACSTLGLGRVFRALGSGFVSGENAGLVCLTQLGNGFGLNAGRTPPIQQLHPFTFRQPFLRCGNGTVGLVLWQPLRLCDQHLVDHLPDFFRVTNRRRERIEV